MKLWLIKQGAAFLAKHWKKILLICAGLILLLVAGVGFLFTSMVGGVITPLTFGGAQDRNLYESYVNVEEMEGVDWPDMAAYDALMTNGTFTGVDEEKILTITAKKFIYYVVVCEKGGGCHKEKRFYTLEEVLQQEGVEEKDIEYAEWIKQNITDFLPDAPPVPGTPADGSGTPGAPDTPDSPGTTPGTGPDDEEYVPIDPEIIENNVFIWPVPSAARISSPYGYRIHPVTGKRKLHAGLDISNRKSGSTVIASSDGVVYQVRSASDGNYCGNWIKLKHDDGYTTRYCHLSRVFVSPGDKVKAGRKIGAIGATGRVTGPHLHFEIGFNGATVDPMPYIEKTRP
ncbi:M23 family metallopeptidase [Paenibacillus jiagnxiensis]|uniref:M23 family metallopeptidase n=1 Tax=Paenibacillus jiagnxiensis TaxID=3228926 RepID=UPI0033A047B0